MKRCTVPAGTWARFLLCLMLSICPAFGEETAGNPAVKAYADLARNESPEARALRIAEIDLEIAALQEQIESLAERKRALLEAPTAPPPAAFFRPAPDPPAAKPRIFTGPRGGRYRYSASGKKIYQERSKR